MTNPYCEALGIGAPALEGVAAHPEASPYRLMIVALLEQGSPMTLPQVANRFAQAGIAPVDAALRSLKRCRPGRAPVYRDGDHYALDPHDGALDFLLFALGLRPRRWVAPAPGPTKPKEATASPGPDVALNVAELGEAWREAGLSSWSPQRVALCILDAHRRPMAPAEVLAFIDGLTSTHVLRAIDGRWGRPTPLRVLDDGRWTFEPGHPWLLSARKAVRDRLTMVRKWAATRPDPAAIQASQRASEERRARHGEELTRLRRLVVHAFPPAAPQAVVFVDVATREITTHAADQLARVHDRLNGYDVIVGLGVRALLRALRYDPGSRRLAELGPPRKSTQLNERGRTLRITTPMLVWGSCGIGRPFGPGGKERLRRYLRVGQTAKLFRRLEADAKALFALYQYGCLHGAVRLRWGFLDEMIPAPWVHRDETGLHELKARAQILEAPLEIVVGSAPGWEDPWARARRCRVVTGRDPWQRFLVDENGSVVEDRRVQLARLV